MGESFNDVDLQYILDVYGDGETINRNSFIKFMNTKLV